MKMKPRKFSESKELRDRLNAILAIMGFIYEEGSRTRYDLRGFLEAIVTSQTSLSMDGRTVTFSVRSRTPVSQSDLQEKLKSGAPL